MLKDAGLVEVRADAQRRYYRVRPEPLRQIDVWLAPYRATWERSFDALEQHLDTTAAPTTSEQPSQELR